MGARPDSTNPWSGPRLPKQSIRGPRSDDPVYDPSSGGCFNCGDKAGVMEFILTRNGHTAGHWRLCGPCFEWGNVRDPQATDPLTA